MTKKDYIIIARALNIHAWNNQGDKKAIELLEAITETLSQELQAQNTRFDKQRFIEAVFKK